MANPDFYPGSKAEYTDPLSKAGGGLGTTDTSSVDLSDPELGEAKARVLSKDDEADWCLFQFVGQTSKLKLVECDSGGWEECMEYLSEGRQAFGLVSIELEKDMAPKNVYFTWNPDNVPATMKGVFHGRASDVAAWFSPAQHLEVHATNEEDLDKEKVLGQLRRGANK